MNVSITFYFTKSIVEFSKKVMRAAKALDKETIEAL